MLKKTLVILLVLTMVLGTVSSGFAIGKLVVIPSTETEKDIGTLTEPTAYDYIAVYVIDGTPESGLTITGDIDMKNKGSGGMYVICDDGTTALVLFDGDITTEGTSGLPNLGVSGDADVTVTGEINSNSIGTEKLPAYSVMAENGATVSVGGIFMNAEDGAYVMAIYNDDSDVTVGEEGQTGTVVKVANFVVVYDGNEKAGTIRSKNGGTTTINGDVEINTSGTSINYDVEANGENSQVIINGELVITGAGNGYAVDVADGGAITVTNGIDTTGVTSSSDYTMAVSNQGGTVVVGTEGNEDTIIEGYVGSIGLGSAGFQGQAATTTVYGDVELDGTASYTKGMYSTGEGASITVEGDVTLNANSGYGIYVTSGGYAEADSVTVNVTSGGASNGVCNMEGTVNVAGDVTLNSTAENNYGSVAVASAMGTTTVEGDITANGDQIYAACVYLGGVEADNIIQNSSNAAAVGVGLSGTVDVEGDVVVNGENNAAIYLQMVMEEGEEWTEGETVDKTTLVIGDEIILNGDDGVVLTSDTVDSLKAANIYVYGIDLANESATLCSISELDNAVAAEPDAPTADEVFLDNINYIIKAKHVTLVDGYETDDDLDLTYANQSLNDGVVVVSVDKGYALKTKDSRITKMENGNYMLTLNREGDRYGYICFDAIAAGGVLCVGQNAKLGGLRWKLCKNEKGIFTLVSVDTFTEDQLADKEALLRSILTDRELSYIQSIADNPDQEYLNLYFDGETGHIQIVASHMIF